MECDNDEKIFLSYLVGKKMINLHFNGFCQVDVYNSKNLFIKKLIHFVTLFYSFERHIFEANNISWIPFF